MLAPDFGSLYFSARCEIDSCGDDEFCVDEGGVVECLPLIPSGGPCFENAMCDSGRCKLDSSINEEELGECE